MHLVKKEVTAKDFYRQIQITDIFTIDVNKVVLSYGHGITEMTQSRWSADTTVYEDA